MSADIARLDLSNRLRSLIGYSLGLALYALVIVAIYPAFKHSTSLDSLTKNDSTAAALFGVSGSLTSPAGWLDGNIYANFFPLVMLLVTIGYGAAALAGQNEDGTLCLVAVLPRPRRAIVLHKVLAMSIQGFVLAAAVAACVLFGRSFDVLVSPGHVVAISVAVLLMGLDFGLIAMTIGALSGRRGTAIGITAALAAAAYLVSSLAPVVPGIRPARYLSLFYWSVGNNQVRVGVSAADFVVLAVVGLCAAYTAVLAFRGLDLN